MFGFRSKNIVHVSEVPAKVDHRKTNLFCVSDDMPPHALADHYVRLVTMHYDDIDLIEFERRQLGDDREILTTQLKHEAHAKVFGDTMAWLGERMRRS